MLLIPQSIFRRRRGRVKLAPVPPPTPPPVPVHVVQVIGAYGYDNAVWHLDRAVTILPGATFDMFVLSEEGGEGRCVGVSGSVLSGNRLNIQLDSTPTDTGNRWFWGVESEPEKIVASDGGRIAAESGDLIFDDVPH
jgi:hypothetical protein